MFARIFCRGKKTGERDARADTEGWIFRMKVDGREGSYESFPVFVFTREKRQTWKSRTHRYAGGIYLHGSKYKDYLACSVQAFTGRGPPDRRLSAFGRLPAERRTVHAAFLSGKSP